MTNTHAIGDDDMLKDIAMTAILQKKMELELFLKRREGLDLKIEQIQEELSDLQGKIKGHGIVLQE